MFFDGIAQHVHFAKKPFFKVNDVFSIVLNYLFVKTLIRCKSFLSLGIFFIILFETLYETVSGKH